MVQKISTRMLFLAIVALFFAQSGFASGVRNFSLDGSIHANMHVQLLQIVKSHGIPYNGAVNANTAVDYRHSWINQIGGELTVTGNVTDRMSGLLTYAGMIWNTPEDADLPPVAGMMVTGGVNLAYLQYIWGNLEKPSLILKAGLFNYQYAPEVKDLGGYLFKGNCYPGFVISGGGGYDMLGFHLHSDFVKNLTQDLIFNSMIDIFPNFDWSLGYVAQYNIADILKIGGGVQFYRLISVLEDNTTPASFGKVTGPVEEDGSAKIDTLTHRGIKVMARLVFDPKPIIHSSIFGKEDLKLYAEATILGVQDQFLVYEDISERIPVTWGFNFPTFKLLDYLALEMEWYGSPYKNNPYRDGSPLPADHDDEEKQPGSIDDIKWAVTASKTVVNGVEFTARAARDHYRVPDGKGYYFTQELMARPDFWYWSFIVKFSF